MKKKRILYLFIVIFLILKPVNILADTNNDKLIEEQNQIDSNTINELKDNINDINKNMDYEKKNYESTIDILKINLEESNNKNNYLMTYFSGVIDIIALIFAVIGVVITVVGTLVGVKFNNMRKQIKSDGEQIKKDGEQIKNDGEEITKKHSECKKELEEIKRNKEEIIKDREEINSIIGDAAEMQNNLQEKFKDISITINSLDNTAKSYQEDNDIEAFKDRIEIVSAELKDTVYDDKDKNQVYVDDGVIEENKILNLKLGREEK